MLRVVLFVGVSSLGAAAVLVTRSLPGRTPRPAMTGTPDARVADVGSPPIEALAVRQRSAAVLSDNWPTVVERLGGVLAGDCVVGGTSERHGIGLFARRDIEEGELVALHPAHRVLQQVGGGSVAGALVDEEDDAYFRPAAGSVSDDELAYRQIAYRRTYGHINPQRPESFLLDANPTKPDVQGWMGHRINDGASASPGAAEEALAEYYRASAGARNCVAVSLCVPLLGFVATKAVAAGDELLATYGHAYWTQSVAPSGEAVDTAYDAAAREAALFQVATDKRYSKHIAALDEFITKASQPPSPQEGDVDADAGGPAARAAPPAPPAGAGSGGRKERRAAERKAAKAAKKRAA